MEQAYPSSAGSTSLARSVTILPTGCVDPGVVTTCDGPNPQPLVMPIFTISGGGVAGVVLGMVTATIITAAVSFYAGKKHVGVLSLCGHVLYDPDRPALGKQDFEAEAGGGGLSKQEEQQ